MLFFLAIAALFASPIVGDSCTSYTHPQYGKVGKCIPATDCPYSLYVSNLCETQPATVKCCFSSTTTSVGGCPSIVNRAGWNARAPNSRSPMSTPVTYVVIHHTTGGSCTSKDSCASKMRGFQNYHMDNNGWSDIGYNFLVGEDGNAYEGRGWTLSGAHTYGYNSQSMGISIIGDYMSLKPNAAALNAVKALIQCGVSKGYIKSNYLLRGHRDLDSTTCPGNVLYNEIKTWPAFRSSLRSDAGPSFDLPEDYLVMRDM